MWRSRRIESRVNEGQAPAGTMRRHAVRRSPRRLHRRVQLRVPCEPVRSQLTHSLMFSGLHAALACGAAAACASPSSPWPLAAPVQLRRARRAPLAGLYACFPRTWRNSARRGVPSRRALGGLLAQPELNRCESPSRCHCRGPNYGGCKARSRPALSRHRKSTQCQHGGADASNGPAQDGQRLAFIQQNGPRLITRPAAPNAPINSAVPTFTARRLTVRLSQAGPGGSQRKAPARTGAIARCEHGGRGEWRSGHDTNTPRRTWFRAGCLTNTIGQCGRSH